MDGGFSVVTCLQIITFFSNFFGVHGVVSMIEDDCNFEAADIYIQPLSVEEPSVGDTCEQLAENGGEPFEHKVPAITFVTILWREIWS